MKRLDNPNVVCFDVDGTLIKPFCDCTPEEQAGLPSILIETPWGKDQFVLLEHIIARVRRQHMQGHYTIVWSQGGHEWAEQVVKALKLEECVDQIMTKPKWYMDDLPADEWMTRTIP